MKFRLQKGLAVVVAIERQSTTDGTFVTLVRLEVWNLGGFSSWPADSSPITVPHMSHLCEGENKPPTLLIRMRF